MLATPSGNRHFSALPTRPAGRGTHRRAFPKPVCTPASRAQTSCRGSHHCNPHAAHSKAAGLRDDPCVDSSNAHDGLCRRNPQAVHPRDLIKRHGAPAFGHQIDPQGASYAINQALIAIGSGGFAGKGFKATGTQVEQGFIPGTTVHTDYIFTAIGEQWGFLGNVVLISAFGGLLVACLYSAQKSADVYGLVISTGFAMQIFFHVYQNIGMTIAIMPITGLPLPLISYGGTFLLMNMFALGLINSVWIHRREVV